MREDRAQALIRESSTVSELKQAAAGCRACPLWARGTQTVFGEGSSSARVVMIGEQPGDKEDRQGRPFVGPAGWLLDRALAEADVPRDEVYVTNAVKHFKWEPRGKRRIHKKPNSSEIGACKPWLDAELDLIKPDVIVCLGATAAQAILGRSFRVSVSRGQLLPGPDGSRVLATVHPSSILRAPDEETRRLEMRRFVEDLKKLRAALE